MRRITDANVKHDGLQCNFEIYYPSDGTTVATALRSHEENKLTKWGWYLLTEPFPPPQYTRAKRARSSPFRPNSRGDTGAARKRQAAVSPHGK